jgi:hypothetical protein
VSCCEILNNLIFPAHEQHHNTSFLIAAVVKGQSNMAAGSTIGSNHNSRANDGEVEAGRGFWPGLSSSIKHSSYFASYCLLSKGSYRFELDIPFPFALVADNESTNCLEIIPAYWWMHNMYALLRNESKFIVRDKRHTKPQNIEFSPFAPDTAEEIFLSLKILERLVGRAWYRSDDTLRNLKDTEVRKKGHDLLLGPKEAIDALEILGNGMENSKRKVIIKKPRKAYKAYRHLLRWYALCTLINYFAENPEVTFEKAKEMLSGIRVAEWENLGGQLVPCSKVEALIEKIRTGSIYSWDEVHTEYAKIWTEYPLDKAKHSWATLIHLLGTENLVKSAFENEIKRFIETTKFIEEQVYLTRQKDYENKFKKATFRNEAEMQAVLGTARKNSFIHQMRTEMERWRARADMLLTRL